MIFYSSVYLIIPPPSNMSSLLYNTKDWPGVGDFTGLSNITFILLSSIISTVQGDSSDLNLIFACKLSGNLSTWKLVSCT